MEKIKRLLQLECNYRLPEPILDEFLGLAVEIHLDARDVLVMSGQVDPDIFIVKEGILSHSYFDGEKEKVAYFSLPGTMTSPATATISPSLPTTRWNHAAKLWCCGFPRALSTAWWRSTTSSAAGR